VTTELNISVTALDMGIMLNAMLFRICDVIYGWLPNKKYVSCLQDDVRIVENLEIPTDDPKFIEKMIDERK